MTTIKIVNCNCIYIEYYDMLYSSSMANTRMVVLLRNEWSNLVSSNQSIKIAVVTKFKVTCNPTHS